MGVYSETLVERFSVMETTQPQWSGRYPDFIVIKSAPNVVEISGMAGEFIDRRNSQFLEIAARVHGLQLIPTNEFEVSEAGVAEVWLLTSEKDTELA